MVEEEFILKTIKNVAIVKKLQCAWMKDSWFYCSSSMQGPLYRALRMQPRGHKTNSA